MSVLERARRSVKYRLRQRRGFDLYDSTYLNWMEFANAGMLHPGNRTLMARAVAELPTGDPVVEIGAFCGLSSNVLTHLLKEHGRQNVLVTTDPWVFEGEDGETLPGSNLRFTEYRRLVKESYKRNVEFWNGDRRPHAFELTSDAFFAAWDAGAEREDVFGRPFRLGGPIAFAYVDGDHSYEFARRDFENVDRHLVPGGLILFDDSDEFGAFPGVTRTVREAIDAGYELVGENPNHLVRKPA